MSMYCTDPETLKARKKHLCDSCGEPVLPGETYRRWRCYDGGEAGTVKMHPECHDMHCKDARDSGGGAWEFYRWEHERPTVEVGATP